MADDCKPSQFLAVASDLKRAIYCAAYSDFSNPNFKLFFKRVDDFFQKEKPFLKNKMAKRRLLQAKKKFQKLNQCFKNNHNFYVKYALEDLLTVSLFLQHLGAFRQRRPKAEDPRF